MNIKMLKAALAGLVLSISSFANAVLITQVLNVEVVNGPETGVLGSITIEYDDLLISGTGDESLSNPDFSLTLDLFGQIFSNADDVDFPLFPELLFSDGEISFIDFIISESFGNNPTDIAISSVDTIAGGDVIDSTWQVTTLVPEPSILAIFVLGIMGLASRRLKK